MMAFCTNGICDWAKQLSVWDPSSTPHSFINANRESCEV